MTFCQPCYGQTIGLVTGWIKTKFNILKLNFVLPILHFAKNKRHLKHLGSFIKSLQFVPGLLLRIWPQMPKQNAVYSQTFSVGIMECFCQSRCFCCMLEEWL